MWNDCLRVVSPLDRISYLGIKDSFQRKDVDCQLSIFILKHNRRMYFYNNHDLQDISPKPLY